MRRERKNERTKIHERVRSLRKEKNHAYPAGTDAEKERQNEMCDHIDKYVKNYELGLLTVTEVMNEISLWVWRVQ